MGHIVTPGGEINVSKPTVFGPWRMYTDGQTIFVITDGGNIREQDCIAMIGPAAELIHRDRAALIAAAPDLLAALVGAQSWLEDSDIQYLISHKKGEHAALHKTLKMIRDAKLKANV